jgi:ubiquinone/menaquinone biosynthesis C-methylase UbiE
MINVCIKKFENYLNKISFLTAHARSLRLFKNNSFDFIFFNFTGMDCADYEERMAILREIRRLIRPMGYFCFHQFDAQIMSCLNTDC